MDRRLAGEAIIHLEAAVLIGDCRWSETDMSRRIADPAIIVERDRLMRHGLATEETPKPIEPGPIE